MKTALKHRGYVPVGWPVISVCRKHVRRPRFTEVISLFLLDDGARRHHPGLGRCSACGTGSRVRTENKASYIILCCLHLAAVWLWMPTNNEQIFWLAKLGLVCVEILCQGCRRAAKNNMFAAVQLFQIFTSRKVWLYFYLFFCILLWFYFCFLCVWIYSAGWFLCS